MVRSFLDDIVQVKEKKQGRTNLQTFRTCQQKEEKEREKDRETERQTSSLSLSYTVIGRSYLFLRRTISTIDYYFMCKRCRYSEGG